MFSYQYASVIADCSFDHVVFQGLLREIKLTAGVIPQFGKVGDWEDAKSIVGRMSLYLAIPAETTSADSLQYNFPNIISGLFSYQWFLVLSTSVPSAFNMINPVSENPRSQIPSP